LNGTLISIFVDLDADDLDLWLMDTVAGNKVPMMSLAATDVRLAEETPLCLIVRCKSQDTQIAAALSMSIETSLSSLVRVIAPDRDDEPEDIFAAAPGFLFTDDLTNSHGAPESIIQYKNARFGALELQTADPVGEDERQLFSHYLWNAGLKLAELISHADEHQDKRWSVEGESILELGAGVGLSGIVSTLAGAQEVRSTKSPKTEGSCADSCGYRSSSLITQPKW
jgi:hypothetical protein